jgi:nucleoside-diphosphate-sugar epimerase
MKIAIFGSTSNIAKDVITFFSKKNTFLDLYSRRDKNFSIFINIEDKIQKFNTLSYDNFDINLSYDAIINFIGIGNPALENESDLVSSAYHFDSIILDYLNHHRLCKYIYISSGAVYGNNFFQPIPEIGRDVRSGMIDSDLSNYARSKLNCEMRHQENKDASIFDVRIFNYFSHRANNVPGHLMSDICRSILDKSVLYVKNNPIKRDYIDPDDFCMLLNLILHSNEKKMVIDCRSKKEIINFELLELMKRTFGLVYEISNSYHTRVDNLLKKNYYSLMNNDRKLGFIPKYSSEESLIKEVNRLLALKAVK